MSIYYILEILYFYKLLRIILHMNGMIKMKMLLVIISILSVYQAGEYYVYVVDENGCSDQSDLSIINVVPRSELFVPNSFTPNSDRHNELFIIHAKNIRSFNMKIFDRWGDVLFQSDNIEKHWDGTFNGSKVEQDKYLYVIDIIGEDNVPFTKSGIINLLY